MSLLKVYPYDLERDFVPKYISGLTLWLDYTNGVYTDTTLTSAAAINDTVKGWRDLSGNGYHATESTNPPTLSADGLQFDGVNDVLRVARMTGQFGAGYTISLVAYLNDGRPASIRVLFGALQPTPSRGYWDNLLFAGGNFRMALYENGTAYPFVFANIFPDGQTSRFISTNTATPGGNIVGYFNGVANGAPLSIVAATWENIATAITEAPFIGARNSNGVVDSPTNVNIASVLIYNRPLTTPELTQVHRYLGKRYGISVP